MSMVCVHGLGHIGLPTAAMLAEAGHEVVGCDVNPCVVALAAAGRAGFREPGLDALLARAVRVGRLSVQAMPAPAAFHLIAVPTPCTAGQLPDLRCVEAATDAFAPVLRAGDTVILESTVPVGTTEALAARLRAARPDLRVPGEVAIAYCPERVLPGRILQELVENDRVVGGLTPGCAAAAARLYRSFVRGEVILADARMAELVKLAENAFRDVNIAFANELSLLCDRLGVDARQAIALANRHPRVQVLEPGVGVGGHCIPIDPWFLASAAPEDARLIRAARAVNDAVPRRIAQRLRDAAARLDAPRIACLGLAYKPDVGDLRESPAVAIVAELLRDRLNLIVADPFVAALPPVLGGVALMGAAEAVAAADIVAILVAHTPYHALDRSLFEGKVVLDAVGLLAP
ncbi:UDP-N-acetyl-D-mannosamine dehydrogenase [Falsiroseomonas sp.]|uniref:UDP-N-acetyl-D-mannosamine dehydrogenase n=1 Tax=Falsiroseomonas sp. TaxID=2870721 RepID=UPI0034A3EE57